jgi:flagellin-like protein
MLRKSKRGISPVIATILLVVIAIALFGVIYIWINRMQQDTILKFDSDIRQSCLDVNFDVSVQGEQSGTVQVQNLGTFTLYKAIIYKRTASEILKIGEIGGSSGIGASEAANLEPVNLEDCQQIKVVPVLLGISKKTGQQQEYVCQDKAKTISC